MVFLLSIVQAALDVTGLTETKNESFAISSSNLIYVGVVNLCKSSKKISQIAETIRIICVTSIIQLRQHSHYYLFQVRFIRHAFFFTRFNALYQCPLFLWIFGLIFDLYELELDCRNYIKRSSLKTFFLFTVNIYKNHKTEKF